ncbi:CBASS cGAMP synthase [Erwinia pyrifoliae]|uniref:CBASS cGAMP synthase n=1 Tax=Erwinia pyrifoliae TaxID=79967 RepID=UPI00220187BD|nr:CBASS cGAMP synthase [Erwinia pyrifoliae]UWS28923.1 CBASS cGAMP synthase [Erwinia pyrifoliae]
MRWDFNNYYSHSVDGLISKLKLGKTESDKLKALRQKVRDRTRDVFKEAREVATDVRKQALTLESVRLKLEQTNVRYLSPSDRGTLARLIFEMENGARDDFIKFQPRFSTQGSFQYDTLNRPFHPGQEMDIDDGTYMPMTVFESEPSIGHTLLLLLVDTSLKSLEAENDGWIFEEKNTCGRIKISREKTHIDVPMYAIPKEQFQTKQTAADSAHLIKSDDAMFESVSANLNQREAYLLESEKVNLALRNGGRRWTISDPKIVEDWFNDSCKRIGGHLRSICRFMKAWRDAQWEVGGPSSISLMTSVVNILDREKHNGSDLTETMKLVAKLLPDEFCSGLQSPDDTDENLLFPAEYDHNLHQKNIVETMRSLHSILLDAESLGSREDALRKINEAFGKRVTNDSLITSIAAAPAFHNSPSQESAPVKINKTMVSG